ncbi:MAG: hypothetical protein DRQ62_04045 [Gammaproteobacteria bacterium]|nr:MAG: hypothetical protein DRQ62_04045 [Gammaproteobacteria bacterium]
MCDCREVIESNLTKRIIELKPEAKNARARLMGYALILGNELKEKGFMAVKVTADFPLKKGGFKERKLSENMIFTYCLFCGGKYA